MKIVWLTDTHLNWAAADTIKSLVNNIKSLQPDALFLTGDISDGDTTREFLKFLHRELQFKIYYVLGNHDFYEKSIQEVYQWCSVLQRKNNELVYLPNASVVKLSDTVGLVGVDGWGDCREGNWRDSRVVLSDHTYIKDLSILNRAELGPKLQALGSFEGVMLQDSLSRALMRFDTVNVLTHVPPFREAATWKGKPSDDDFAPFFVCKATGDVLLELAAANPAKYIYVYCGHSHGKSLIKPLPNLTVYTSDATYRRPKIAEVLEIE